MANPTCRYRVAYNLPYCFPYDNYRATLLLDAGYVQRVLADGEGWEMTDRIHHPKGGMCAVCQHFTEDCSHLDFEKMPVLQEDDERVIVRCTKFTKEN